MNNWAVNHPDSEPEGYIVQVAESLNCTEDDNFAMMDCLRERHWKEIYDARVSCTVSVSCYFNLRFVAWRF